MSSAASERCDAIVDDMMNKYKSLLKLGREDSSINMVDIGMDRALAVHVTADNLVMDGKRNKRKWFVFSRLTWQKTSSRSFVAIIA